ncbi:MAG: hypothetical protein R2801_04590 [Chitinophagales bacterium]
MADSVYYIRNQNGECVSGLSMVTVIANPTPAKPMVEPVSICNGQSAYLTAAGDPNATFSWYDDVDLTNQIQVGANFITPTLTANTTYYVTQSVNGCASDLSSCNSNGNKSKHRFSIN